MGLKTKNWSHLEEDQTVERRKKREEEKKKRKRKRRRKEEKRRGKLSQKGMELCIDLYGTTKLGMDPCFLFG